MPADMVHLHYLNPFWEAMRRRKDFPSDSFGTLYTYENLRAAETDGSFDRIVTLRAQDTLCGYLAASARIMARGHRGHNILLVHQPDYMGPYSLMLLVLLFKGRRVSVYGPQGSRRLHTRRDSLNILSSGAAYVFMRLRAKVHNLTRISAVAPLDRLKLKRPYPLLDRVPPPMLALIEPTNSCNLRCPVCETGNRSLRRRKATMSMEQFRIIVDKLPGSVKEMCLHINGESFLNRDIYRMIQYAAERGIHTFLDTNGLLMDPCEVVKSGLDRITVCLDGDDPRSYATYRIGGDYERLIRNIRGLVAARIEAGAQKPRITLKVIAMRHTERLVDNIAQVARELGADDFQIAQFTARTCEQALAFQSERSEFSKYVPEEIRKGRLTTRYIPNVRECQVPYYAVSVNASGDVDPCCRDMNGEHTFGNLLKDDFESIWNGETAVAFRRSLIAKKPGICRDCQLAINPTLF
ncbi:MAG: radical SAM protein [Thermodesulfobacteriota bacterium]